jgi:hypothetical protein
VVEQFKNAVKAEGKDGALQIDPDRLAAAHTLVGNFDGLLEDLVSGHVYRCRERQAPPRSPGVYCFSQGEQVMHVGRTKDLQARRQNQTSPKGDRFVATFPFLLARHRAAEVRDDLPTDRGELEADERFKPFFTEAKEDVRAMEFRCVEIENHPLQAMFEIFASVALDSRYNFWETH